MVSRKLNKSCFRTSNETANIQTWSDDKQPEPTADEVPITFVTKKACKEKGKILKVKEIRLP